MTTRPVRSIIDDQLDDLELAQRIWFRAFESTLIENAERLVRERRT
ncbi:hypothetical protein [Pseudomonas aeruginosa]|nr:hypothetical protein [Pseudomonas aeruginosa]